MSRCAVLRRCSFSSALKGTVDTREPFYTAVPGRRATARMHVCFYSNDEKPYGIPLGEVQFVIGKESSTRKRASFFQR